MQYAYEKLMAENNLSFNELPSDAKTAISSLTEIVKGINLTKQRGQEPKPASYDKIKVLDKAAVSEIIDYLEEKEEEAGKAQAKIDADAAQAAEAAAAASQQKKEGEEEDEETAYGDAIEAELKELHKSGKDEFTPEEVNQAAPKAYKEIFNSYENEGVNGVKAGKYLLKETSPGSKIFKF